MNAWIELEDGFKLFSAQFIELNEPQSNWKLMYFDVCLFIVNIKHFWLCKQMARP